MIYLDHAAATPVSKKALDAMLPYFSADFFNPSASYLPAKKIAEDYETAKKTIARAIGAKSSDLVMTAGATEANNLAFTVLDRTNYETKNRNSSACLYLATEHDSVRKVAEKYGGQEIKVLKSGLIDLDDLKAKITDDTILISVSAANNELGTIEPLAEIANIIREIRFDRLKRRVDTPLYLHSDASQALNLLDLNVARLGVDLMTINSAKVYGPKGVGALYVSHNIKLAPVALGGGQERGLRSGTENVSGVIGFAAALSEQKQRLPKNRKKYAEYKRLFLAEISALLEAKISAFKETETSAISERKTSAIPEVEIINPKHSLDNFLVLCYNRLDAERLIFLLEEKGVYVSTGAACAASKGEKSHVLKAIGLTDAQIAGSLRISFGETNTKEQIIEAAKIITETAKEEYTRLEKQKEIMSQKRTSK